MLQHLRRVSALAALVTALGLAAAASAQAPLGLSINPTQGVRGDVVDAQVDTDDIAANCITDVAGIRAAFNELYTQIVEEDFVQMYFPDFPDEGICDPTCDNYEQLGFTEIALLTLGISFGFPPGAAETALANHFALTFADIATQEPVGETSTFDPTTGMGSVVVPDVTPGPWAVAAACVVPAFSQFDAAVQAAAAKAMAEGRSLDPLGNTGDTDILDYLAANAVELLRPLVTPEALGVQIFIIQTPTLGFTIDPTEGFPGDTVNGQVDTDDIDQYCETDQADFQAEFQALFEGPYASGGNEGEFFDTFFPSGDFDFTNNEQAAYTLTGLTVFGIALDFGGATATAFQQSFVMTFADLLTQKPIGELGQFDPTTGEGSVIVPDVDPGLYPVAATCVLPTLDLDMLIAGIQANGAFLDSIGSPPDLNSPEFEQFVHDFLGDPNADAFDFLDAIGPTLLQNIVVQRALGVQFFDVLAHLNHFACYYARSRFFVPVPVTLADRFGTRSVVVHKPVDLCAPADKNGEDPEAPDSPDFLTSYRISRAGRFPQVTGVEAENQFGATTLNVRSPERLLVPTAVSLVGPPSSPVGAFLNHFTCYKVNLANGTRMKAPKPDPVTVRTAFETVVVRPKKPKHLCVPASKDGGPVVHSRPQNLLCYKAKSHGVPPKPNVFLANQFGQQTQRLGTRRELCIPTELGSPSGAFL